MFGINDNKSTSPGAVDPQPLDSPATPANFNNNAAMPYPPASPVNGLEDTPAVAPQVDNGPSYPATMTHHVTTSPPAPAPVAPAAQPVQNDEELLRIKQEALHHLEPLVGKLNQTPEEKFKTTMMLLQASDNPALVQEAYAAANAITDEKARAQALLDVVNEINYFTHPGAGAA